VVNRCDGIKNGAATASKSAKEKILRPVEVLFTYSLHGAESFLRS